MQSEEMWKALVWQQNPAPLSHEWAPGQCLLYLYELDRCETNSEVLAGKYQSGNKSP